MKKTNRNNWEKLVALAETKTVSVETVDGAVIIRALSTCGGSLYVRYAGAAPSAIFEAHYLGEIDPFERITESNGLLSCDGVMWPKLPDGTPVAHIGYKEESVKYENHINATADVTKKLTWVSKAASKDISRFSMNSVMIRSSLSSLEMVATDGHRAHRATVSGLCFDGEKLLRLSTVKAIVLMQKMFSNVLIGFSGNYVRVSAQVAHVGTVEFFDNLIDAKFPDIDRAWPRTAFADDNTCIVSVKALKKALTVSKKTRHVEISANGVFVLNYKNECWQALVEPYLKHGNFNVAVNPHYLKDACSMAGGAKIVYRGYLAPVEIMMDLGMSAIVMPRRA